MARFYVPSSNIDESNKTAFITGEDVSHFKNVLRAKAGDFCEVISSDGRRFKCAVNCFVDSKIQLNIESEEKADFEPLVAVTLYQGVPKGEKSELIIQKAVELGVTRIVPVLSERSVVRLDSQKDRDKKSERWNRISMEASKQCGRTFIPPVDTPTSLDKLNFDDKTFKIIAYENESGKTIRQAISDPVARDICIKEGLSVFIGPEGGISPSEIEYLLSKGFVSVSLGKRILRTETAPLMVLSSLRYEFED